MEYLRLMLLPFILTTVASLNETDIPTYDEMSAEGDLPLDNELVSHDDMPSLLTRRIMRGHLVGDTRPYMVYLRPHADEANRILFESHWTCGGVIIHQRYILTSAACIEDAGNFYVISGTHKFVPPHIHDNECVNNGAKKAVWKCIPKSYFFDGDAFDNIRWMVGDIAIVKVEDNFNFERRIKGCDFVPKKISFNNKTRRLERSGSIASIAGWGTRNRFVELDAGTGVHVNESKSAENSVDLLEADVIIISKKGCKKHWDERYHFIIQEEMVCSKDSTDYEPVGADCQEHGVNCKEVGHSDEDYYEDTIRRRMTDRKNLIVHTAGHRSPTRRSRLTSGGFCENDHGGPLIIGQGKSSVVIGVMSACLTREVSNRCYGPFLYTSVYKYKDLISCAIDKSLQEECRLLLKSSNTQLKKEVFDWRGRYTIQRESDEMDKNHWVQRKNNQLPTDDIKTQSLGNNERNHTKGQPELNSELNNHQHRRANYKNKESTEDPLSIKNVILRSRFKTEDIDKAGNEGRTGGPMIGHQTLEKIILDISTDNCK
ncbi:unnamed protein product [Arctia plantaginis]|uniref:Peptidase S1 domain-containing protein n=1 Tax=Arctia plantaginis TaxID=874455 RepID=A0A8S0Z640_ARCPL|nr:unnamed protein product [Arctia plantaginis]